MAESDFVVRQRFFQFLEKHVCKGGEFHFQMFGVFTKYHICKEELELFFELYCLYLERVERSEFRHESPHLIENKKELESVLFHLDFDILQDCKERIYDDEILKCLLKVICELLKKRLKDVLDEELEMAILCKGVQVREKGFGDGFHIQSRMIRVGKRFLRKIRDELVEPFSRIFPSLHLIKTSEEVVDVSIEHCNWFLYGSNKGKRKCGGDLNHLSYRIYKLFRYDTCELVDDTSDLKRRVLDYSMWYTHFFRDVKIFQEVEQVPRCLKRSYTRMVLESEDDFEPEAMIVDDRTEQRVSEKSQILNEYLVENEILNQSCIPKEWKFALDQKTKWVYLFPDEKEFICFLNDRKKHNSKKHCSLNVSLSKVKVKCFSHGIRMIEKEHGDRIRDIVVSMFPEIGVFFGRVAEPMQTEEPNEEKVKSVFFYTDKVKSLVGNKIFVQTQNDKIKYWVFNGTVWVCDKWMWEEQIGLCVDALGFLNPHKVKQLIQVQAGNRFRNNEAKFNCKSDLLPFRNGTLNLVTNKFRKNEAEDYFTIVLDYDYCPMRMEEIQETELWRTIVKIFVDSDVRESAFRAYGTALIGRCIQKFFIVTGDGGNGKGVWDKLMHQALGDFAYTCCQSNLNQARSNGPNPDLAGCEFKRFIVFEEGDDSMEIRNSTLKQLTGGKDIKGRQMYSSETNLKNHGSWFIECNNIPKLKSSVGQAEKRRLFLIPFQSSFQERFRDDFEKKEFKMCPKCDTDEWQASVRNCMINILIPYACDFLNERKQLEMPAVSEAILDEYMNSCNAITEFIVNHVVFIENDESFVRISELFDQFQHTAAYENMTFKQKRECTLKKAIEQIKKLPFLKQYYKHEILRRNVNDSRKIYNVFVNCRTLTDAELQERGL